jgi:hypothetical protein
VSIYRGLHKGERGKSLYFIVTGSVGKASVGSMFTEDQVQDVIDWHRICTGRRYIRELLLAHLLRGGLARVYVGRSYWRVKHFCGKV